VHHISPAREFHHDDGTREKLLKRHLCIRAIFFFIYPLGLGLAIGWHVHGGEGKYYLQMICGVYASSVPF